MPKPRGRRCIGPNCPDTVDTKKKQVFCQMCWELLTQELRERLWNAWNTPVWPKILAESVSHLKGLQDDEVNIPWPW